MKSSVILGRSRQARSQFRQFGDLTWSKVPSFWRRFWAFLDLASNLSVTGPDIGFSFFTSFEMMERTSSSVSIVDRPIVTHHHGNLGLEISGGQRWQTEAVITFPTAAPLIVCATAQVLYAIVVESQAYSLTKVGRHLSCFHTVS